MADKSALTIAFLEKRPVASARALVKMDLRDAAGFLDTLPTRIVSKVFANMGASSAAGLLEYMTPANSASVIQTQDYLLAASILRLISVENRQSILEALPQKLKRNFERSLSFPANTVGARMTTSVIMLTAENSVEDAKLELRNAFNALADLVFVIGSDRKLTGVVRTVLLLKHKDDHKLSSLMETDIPRLSSRSRLPGMNDLTLWDKYNVLPVISRQKHLIGALERNVTLADNDQTAADISESTPVIVSLVEAFLTSILGLAEILTGATVAPTPIGRRRKP